jgi:redox-sensitive bicupin YhaK (pirin superfamily)
LGQDLVLFKNAQGQFGLLDRDCPHRGADLSFGRNEGDGLTLRATPGTRAIVIAGQPLREPIAQYGPFVMNTPAQIDQALADYRNGVLTD